MRKLLKVATISTVAISVAALATDSPPSGFRSDISSGSDIVNGVHKTAASSAARAEWRGTSRNSGSISFDREMKVNGGSNISVAQFLNVTVNGSTGSSQPISQLTVDQQSNGSYRVSIEQGDYDCGFRVTKGQWVRVQAGIGKGGVGWFQVGGQYCQRPASSSRPTAGSQGSGYYYFKYGAYNAASNSVASSVSWR